MRCPMFARHGLAVILVWAAVTPLLRADEPKPTSLAQMLWARTDVILEHHVAAPSRPEMLLAAVKALTANAPPDHLARRLSAVSTPEQFAQLLEDLNVRQDARAAEVASLALLTAVPWRPQFVPPANLKATEQIANNRYVG